MRRFLTIPILAAAITGCATATATPTAQATTVPQVEDPGTELRVEVRDPGDGDGLAVPCWWSVSPAPAEGIIRSATLASYDEAFFLQHS